MRINASVVRRVAYMTRENLFKVPAPDPKPLISAKPLPEINFKCGLGWRVYTPIQPGQATGASSQMPLIVGRARRDERTVEYTSGINHTPDFKRWKISPNYQPSLRTHRQELANVR